MCQIIVLLFFPCGIHQSFVPLHCENAKHVALGNQNAKSKDKMRMLMISHRQKSTADVK